MNDEFLIPSVYLFVSRRSRSVFYVRAAPLFDSLGEYLGVTASELPVEYLFHEFERLGYDLVKRDLEAFKSQEPLVSGKTSPEVRNAFDKLERKFDSILVSLQLPLGECWLSPLRRDGSEKVSLSATNFEFFETLVECC